VEIMTIAERIVASVKGLPPEKQQEVLDFVEFLAQRQAHGQPLEKEGATPESLEQIAVANGWPPGFFTEVVGGWQGEPLVREFEGDYEERDPLL
jgi:hypothetical protein